MPPVPQVGVVDALAWLRVEHLHHQVHQGAVGVELLRRMAAVVGELLDQKLVAVAELILRHMEQRQGFAGEVLQQVLQRGIGQTFLVGPGGIAEDAVEFAGVGGFDRAHRGLQRPAHILGHCAHVGPMGSGRNHEAVIGGGLRIGRIAI